jgi:hypothetical protein
VERRNSGETASERERERQREREREEKGGEGEHAAGYTHTDIRERTMKFRTIPRTRHAGRELAADGS